MTLRGVVEKMTDNLMIPFWTKGLELARFSPRCGARTKSRNGLPCESAAMSNSRCHKHGGASLGAPSGKKHGKYRHGLYTNEIARKSQEYRQNLSEVKQIISELDH